MNRYLFSVDDGWVLRRAQYYRGAFQSEDEEAWGKDFFIKVLKNDDNELVRHEAAFSLGQMSYSSAIPPLIDSTLNDPSMFVRHEAAIALGVVGNKEAKETLQKALNDPDKPVVESAVVALSNIEFMETLSKNEKFAKLTGG